MKLRISLTILVLLGSVASFAADISPLMVQRGDLLLEESFSGSLDPDRWKVAIGDWKIENGVLAGTERPADHHAAVIKTPFTQVVAVVQFSFQFQGSSSLHFSINDAGGHNSRVSIRGDAVMMRKDLDKKDPASFSALLDESGAALAPGAWHTMVVELNGAEMLARIDDKVFVYGSHPGINREKSDFGFPVMGAALFDDVKIWSATPSPAWAQEKEKLLARKGTRPAVDRSGNPAEAFQVAEVQARARLLQADPAFAALVEARAAIQQAIAKQYPVVNRKGPKAEAEKKRLASEDAPYKKLTTELRLAQKKERDRLFEQAPEAKQAWDTFAAAQAKARAAAKQ